MLLEETKRALVEALGVLEGGEGGGEEPVASTSTLHSAPASATAPTPASIPPPAPAPESDFEKPLSVLAHFSLLQDSSGHHQAGIVGVGGEASEAWLSTSQSYYEDGLYKIFDDRDRMSDPVSLGLITLGDLKRLVDLFRLLSFFLFLYYSDDCVISRYFQNLYPFIWQLSPELHTPEFLRETSPFLTTAVAATGAMYDSLSSGYAQLLQDHANSLAVKVFAEELKSVEIVQAYCILAFVLPPLFFFLEIFPRVSCSTFLTFWWCSHWAAPGESWLSNQFWSWQGQAQFVFSLLLTFLSSLLISYPSSFSCPIHTPPPPPAPKVE